MENNENISEMDIVDKLYEKYNQLNEAGDKISELQDAYLYILESMKGTSKEKRLASQFTAKFFKHFPSLYDRTVDSLFDLCEDEDITIRKQAIKELPTICKQCSEYVPKITDILAQLLLAEDSSELQMVNMSLVTLCKINAKGFLAGLFCQIESGEDITRDKIIKFLALKIKTLPDDIWNKEVEEYLLQECRKAMQDCTKEEFLIFISILSSLKISRTVSGQQILVDIITEQAELENPFDISDMDLVDKLLMCVRHSIPHLSPFVPSNSYVHFFCNQVIPSLSGITENHPKDLELQILESLAEMSQYVQPSNTSYQLELEKCLGIVFNKLLEYMPLPPGSETEGVQKALDANETPSIQLTHVESLMYTFHQLCKHNPQFFTSSEDEKIKNFKMRLQYLARGVQNYIKKIKESLANVKGPQMKNDENKLKLVALKTTTNINHLIRDLFHSPPTFKISVNLSWKPPGKPRLFETGPSHPITLSKATSESDVSEGPKRKAIEAPEGSSKKEGRKFYEPPSGKFSSNFRSRGRGWGFRGSYRGRGSFRGRGRAFKKRFSY